MKRAIPVLTISGATALLTLFACEKSPTPPARESGEAPLAAKVAPPKDAPAEVEKPTYRLAIASLEGAAADEQAFEVSLAGVGEWHVNTDYPIAVTVGGDEGVVLPKSRLDREDAAELSDEKARFVFVATAQDAAEAARVSAHVRFAMCIPSSCTFHEETVAVAYASR